MKQKTNNFIQILQILVKLQKYNLILYWTKTLKILKYIKILILLIHQKILQKYFKLKI